jgi:hypothetical protein
MSEQCEHLQRNPQGVEWSDNDALGHFLNCLTEQQQVEYWVHLRRFADTGRVCEMQDHRGVIESLRPSFHYTMSPPDRHPDHSPPGT